MVNLVSYVNTDLFNTNEATVNAIKCGRHVQLNIIAPTVKTPMEGIINRVLLNAIPEEYRPLTLTECTIYSTWGNMSGRCFLDSAGVCSVFFDYDPVRQPIKISGYLFATFNYISAK